MVSIFSKRNIFLKLKITFERNCNLKSFYGSKINFKNESPELENKDKSLNIYETWSRKQIPKSLAMQGPRFENVDIGKQPNPTPAIHLISKISVKKVHENIVSCDGGGGKLGHPKIYINLDQNQPTPCGYCGLIYQKK